MQTDPRSNSFGSPEDFFAETLRGLLGGFPKGSNKAASEACAKTGEEAATPQFSRAGALAFCMTAYLPRDVEELTSADHCLLFHYVLDDGVDDMLHESDKLPRRKLRAQVTAAGRISLSHDRQFQRLRRRKPDEIVAPFADACAAAARPAAAPTGSGDDSHAADPGPDSAAIPDPVTSPPAGPLGGAATTANDGPSPYAGVNPAADAGAGPDIDAAGNPAVDAVASPANHAIDGRNTDAIAGSPYAPDIKAAASDAAARSADRGHARDPARGRAANEAEITAAARVMAAHIMRGGPPEPDPATTAARVREKGHQMPPAAAAPSGKKLNSWPATEAAIAFAAAGLPPAIDPLAASGIAPDAAPPMQEPSAEIQPMNRAQRRLAKKLATKQRQRVATKRARSR
jgi:hypothetical protein